MNDSFWEIPRSNDSTAYHLKHAVETDDSLKICA
jgi:hypothetical protein